MRGDCMFNIFVFYSEYKYCYAVNNLAFVGLKEEKCPHCGCQDATQLVFQGDDALLIDGAKSYPDCMLYGSVGLSFIVSERVMEVLRQENITGYDEAKKVSLYRSRYGKLVKQDPNYYMINITGSIDLDLKAMSLKKKNVCPMCGSFKWSRQRLYTIDSVFDMSTWDGSDICRIKSFPGYIMISDRLKEIFEKHKFTGASFKKENEIFKI